MSKNVGFSLLELLVIVVILVLLTTLATPLLELLQTEREHTLENLEQALMLARAEALRTQKPVKVCASQNQKTCHDNWDQGFIVKAEESVLFSSPSLKYGHLYLQAFGLQEGIVLLPNGMTTNNATFTYCPKNQDQRQADALILNKGGRVYRPTTRDSLGVLLKQEGQKDSKPLTCR